MWLSKFLFCALLIMGFSCWGEHSLTLMNGEPLQGVIVDYQTRSDVLTFRSNEGKQARFKGAQLDDESFKYVRSWAAAQAFKDPAKFRIYVYGPNSVKSWIKRMWRRPPGKVEPILTYETKLERIGYDLKYDNQTGFDLENVRIKYCLFYDQARFDWYQEERAVDVITRPCVEEFAILPNEVTEKMSLKTIVLRNKEHMYRNDGWMLLKCKQDEGRFFPANFIGMILRIEMIGADGEVVIREMRYPDELSNTYVWVEPTAENIDWADDRLDEKPDIAKPPTRFEEMGGTEENEDE